MSSPSIQRLRSLPRLPLIGAPTPIERVERFEAAIGSRSPIYIKRDDAIPFGFGGNKVRKLELVMAEALQNGCDTVITCGGVQSNHCRATAAAAARAGVDCHLVLSGPEPATLRGNTRLDDLFGAKLHFVADRRERTPRMATVEAALRGEGRKPAVIPLGASNPLGAAGFALAILEMLDQDFHPDVMVHASSSGGTQAGLLAGLALADVSCRVVGVSADETTTALQRIVEDLESGVLAIAESSAAPRPAEVHDQFVGGGYGVPTEASEDAQRLLARSEAIVVDHTYTAKALAGLISLSRGGTLTEGSKVLFWHTGGQVGVLA